MRSHLFFRITLWLLFLWLMAVRVSAQTNVNMPDNGSIAQQQITPPTTCFFNFYDSGGPAGNYNNLADANVTFVPSNPATHRVRITFNAFDLEENWDALYIFNSTAVGTNQVPGPDGATLAGFPAGNWSTTAPTTITANTGLAAVGSNPNEALTIQFRSDILTTDAGWFAVVNQVPKVSCTITAPANIGNASTTGGNCAGDVPTPAPTFSPGGCAASYQLQYRVNGGAPVVVPNPIPTNITLLNVPKGSNAILWELVDPCGGGVVSSAVQQVSVVDKTPPTVNCPGNITINLGPGDCAQAYTYNITCSDNCPFGVVGEVSHPIDFNNGDDGIMFDVANLGAAPITLTQFAPSLDPGNWTIRVYVTTNAATWQGVENTPGAWTLAGQQQVTSVGTNPGTPVPGFNITLTPGQSRGIYITSIGGNPMNYTGTGPGVSRSFDDGVLRVSSSPGAGKDYPFGATFTSRAYNGTVSYSTGANGAAQLLSGLPSGAEFPIGTTTNIYRCFDMAGNSATCSFTVTVVEFATPITQLACNSLISVALGPDCKDTLNADQILEGGPYRCYDHYIVQIDKIPPFNNGPWVPAILDGNDIGKTYGVKVTDPTTGNNCNSTISVMDNLPPFIDCTPSPVDLPCNFNTAPTYSKNVPITQNYLATGLPKQVLDFQTQTVNIPVSAPSGAVINDVDLRLRINGDPFEFNLDVFLESPAGTTVQLWNQQGGCAPAPLFIRFDDEGSAGTGCINFTTNSRTQAPSNPGALAAFDGESPIGAWKIHVSDVNGFGDVSNIVTAELIVNYNATFGTGFPNGLKANQLTQTSPNTFVAPTPLLDYCSDVTLTFADQSDPEGCSSGYTAKINRKWTARDAAGNSTSCTQIINLLRPDLEDIVLPPNYDDIDEPVFACGSPYPSPAWIEGQGKQGFPYVFGLPFGCSINWTYEDLVINICDGTYTIARKWSIVDFCTSQTLQTDQIIRVQDKQGPSFECPANLTVSTDLYTCCATVNLPDVIVEDACSRLSKVQAVVVRFDQYTNDTLGVFVINGSGASFPGNLPSDPDTLAVLGNTPCLSIGTHTVFYKMEDACGNASTCSFTLTVRDYTEPTAVCDEVTTVALGADDPNDCYEPSADGCQFGGVTWVKATTFDDGSYDNCGFVKFTVRRAQPYSDCIEALNKQNGSQPCNDGFPDQLSEYGRATQESDSIKFYCCEVGTTIDVVLRVYQLDALGNISIGPDGGPVYNECMVQVEVQDKLKPGCISPANVTVSCENFDPSLWAYGTPQVIDNCCLDPNKEYNGQKGIDHTASYTAFDTACNRGTINRTFRVYDCHGLSTTCTQRIVVTYDQDYYVKFPNDVLVTFCDTSGMYGVPTFFGEDCEQLGVSFEDEVFTVVPDACYKIERTWHIINWCTYNPNLPLTYVPNPNPNATLNHPSNLVGPTVSAPNTPAPWAPTMTKINPSDQTSVNYSIYWSANTNGYEYKQIIKIVDQQDPTVEECPPAPIEFCDVTENDQYLWNEPYWYDFVHGMHDLCEGPVELSVTATDACSGANLTIRYLLFLDLDANGSMETVVSSTNLPPAGTVNYNNLNSVNYGGGTSRNFDQRQVPNNMKYRFAIQTTVEDDKKTAIVRWNTDAQPGIYHVPQLPYGTHKIKWIIEDGCGNETICEYQFYVKDTKAPSVVCINGLTANISPMNMAMLQVSDFLQFAVDNCTPYAQLQFGIRRSDTGTGFPFDSLGNPITSLAFMCDDIGTQEVELWAIDKAGNADFCETYVIIQDNADNCNPNQKMSVAGYLQTSAGDGLEEAAVEMQGLNPAGPPLNMYDMTDQNGSYVFSNALPLFSNYTVTPTKDDNPLNGVSTYDLVLISRHILGIEPFDTPYKMIAADANKSGSITSYDIVELRRLILGVYDELPDNTSWRFIDKSFVFTNPDNPFHDNFPEVKTVANIQSSQMDDDFVAVKIGDVNDNVLANSLMQSDDRSAGTVLFDLDEQDVKAGQEFTVTLKGAEAIAGYQFTLLHPGLKLVDIQGQALENFAVFADRQAITTSWNAPANQETMPEFTLRFRALQNGKLSEMLSVSSQITKAEAYKGADMSKNDVALRFNGEYDSVISGVGFELYQNQPNPFIHKTLIGFHLPEAGSATLTIYDQAGRQLYTITGEFDKGYNAIPVEMKVLNTTGLLHYTLRTPHDQASRSMIQSH